MEFPEGACGGKEGRDVAKQPLYGDTRNGLTLVAVDGIHGEGGEADGDVFGAAFKGSGVADPLAGVGDDGLSGGDVDGSGLVFDAQGAFEDDGEFVEGGSLAGL